MACYLKSDLSTNIVQDLLYIKKTQGIIVHKRNYEVHHQRIMSLPMNYKNHFGIFIINMEVQYLKIHHNHKSFEFHGKIHIIVNIKDTIES